MPALRFASVLILFIGLSVSFTVMAKESRLGNDVLSADVHETLERFMRGKGSYASHTDYLRDRAVLFMHNDKVNAAALNGEISDAVFQAVQTDYDELNIGFGKRAADHAGAGFTVQTPANGKKTAKIFSPGTDSDYITIITDPDQIGQMQAHYNQSVNEWLQQNGAIGDAQIRKDWHNKLDVDFMADPRGKPGGPPLTLEEFEKIADLNNDAYRRRASAEYERISRAKDGSLIGPEHVTDYVADMEEFTTKKQKKLADLFADPSNFSSAEKRAEAMRLMAQEQKYISRMEALDEYLRKQERLRPRNRGLTDAKQGSVRSPSNAAKIKAGHRVARRSHGQAIANLVETMAEVAESNPNFRTTSTDDIAKLIARAPAQYRGAAMARLQRFNPRLAKAVSASPHFAVDDLARTGKLAGLADDVSDISRIARIRKGLSEAFQKLNGLMEGLGKAATALEAFQSLAGLKEGVALLDRSYDEKLSPKEAARLRADAGGLIQHAVDSGTLLGLSERVPWVASLMGTLSAACGANEYVGSSRTIKGVRAKPEQRTCAERQYDALVHLIAHMEKQALARQAAGNTFAYCRKLEKAVAEGRIVIWPRYELDQVCDAIGRGNYRHMIDWTSSKPKIVANDNDRKPDTPAPKAEIGISGFTPFEEIAIIEADEWLAQTEKLSQACVAAGDVLKPNGELDQLVLKLRDDFADLRRPYEEKGKLDRRSQAALMSDLQAAKSAVSKSQELALDRANLACKMADEADSHNGLAARAHEQVQKSRNIAALADQIVNRQFKILEALRARFTAEGSSYDAASIERSLNTIGSANGKRCRKIFDRVWSHYSNLKKQRLARNQAVQRAVGAVSDMRARAGDTSELLFAELRLELSMERVRKDSLKCVSTMQAMWTRCEQIGNDAFAEEAEFSQNVIKEISDRRQAWLIDLDKKIASLGEIAKRAEAEANRAKQCAVAAIANGKRKPANKGTRNAEAKPNHLSKAKCVPAAPSPPRYSAVLCGKPDAIYDSCFSVTCRTEQEIAEAIAKRHDSADVKFKSKTLCDIPQPAAKNETCAPAQSLEKMAKASPAEPEPTKHKHLERKPDKEPARKSAAEIRCAALNRQVDNAVQRFRRGQIKSAARDMKRVRSDFRALPTDGACETVRQRAENIGTKLTKLASFQDKVDDALSKCDPVALSDRLHKLSRRRDGKRLVLKNPTLRRLRNRTARAVPVAERFKEANQALDGRKIALAESLFYQARAAARAGGQTCKNIEEKIGEKLREIAELQEQNWKVNCPQGTRLRNGECQKDKPALTAQQRKRKRKCEKALANFASFKKQSAFALASNGGCGFSYGYKTRAEARRRALAECKRRGSGCRIVR